MAGTLTVRVAGITDETPDIRSFRLVKTGQGELPAFTAGAHLDVRMPGGPMRPYSLCSDPADRTGYTIAVKREPASRGGSAAMHQLREGDMLEVSAPRNAFPLADGPGTSVLLAGGVGITPLMAMARVLAAAGRPFVLHCFIRSEEHLAFRQTLTSPAFATHVRQHPALAPEAVGALLQQVFGGMRPGDHAYVCGPGPFIDAAVLVAAAHVAPGALHTESFTAAPAVKPDDGGFDVVLALSGRTCRVSPDKSIAQALQDMDIPVEMSCEQGICGTCLTRVIEGCPDHRDMYLLDEEKAANDRMCICVSRALSDRLVLEL